jgi:hypothetical protein
MNLNQKHVYMTHQIKVSGARKFPYDLLKYLTMN